MKSNIKNKWLIIQIIVPALIIIFLISNAPTFLSVTHRVDANTLVVEGWMSSNALKIAFDEYMTKGYEQIITTGLATPDYYPLVMNGSLVFNTQNHFKNNLNVQNHLIEVNLFSDLGHKQKAHFNILLNNVIIGDFYASKRKKDYKINWEGNLSIIDSISIQFDNDKMGKFGDRNLNIKGITINHGKEISYKNNSVYNIKTKSIEERRRINYDSYATKAMRTLVALGLDSSNITIISGNDNAIHKTYESAASFLRFNKNTNIPIKGINVISIGSHSRRTWMSYKKVLKKSGINVGIISIDPKTIGYSKFFILKNFISEIIKTSYYFLLLQIVN